MAAVMQEWLPPAWNTGLSGGEKFGIVRGIIVLRSRILIVNLGAALKPLSAETSHHSTNLCEKTRDDAF